MVRQADRRGILSPALALNIAIMLVALGTTYGILSSRISGMEKDMLAFESRYEREVVPRSEHLQMNAVLEQRLQSIMERQIESQKQVESMQSKIDELLRRKN
jgi:hypothetical protein